MHARFKSLSHILDVRYSPRKRILIAFGALFFVFFVWSIHAPRAFPVGVLVEIPEGATLSETAEDFRERGILRSPLLFRLAVHSIASERGVISGQYFFKEPLSLFSVAKRVTEGTYGLTPVRVLIPEGASVVEMADLLESKFPDFEKNEFIRLAKKDEGYLFPDTYFFLPNVKAHHVYKDLRRNFNKRIKEIAGDIEKSGKTLHEIITMASLLEEEARKAETRKMIAGILWERLEIGMPLQVDAVFGYINGKNTYTLTLDDLQVDSPYNTYKYKGLPPGPITNPGLAAMRAALDPTPSPYLFFLSDREGNTYYSETFEEHKFKKAKYLTYR